MNKEYIKTESGDIVVFDEFGIPSVITNTDNYRDYLEQQNIVETIQNKIEELEKELKEYPSLEKLNNRIYIPVAIPTIFACCIVVILTMMIGSGNIRILMETISRGTETIKVYQLLLFPILACTPIGALIDYSLYKGYQKDKRTVNAKTAALEALKKSKEEEQKKLAILSATQTIKDCKIIEIPNEDVQQVVDEEELFYLHIESNFKRYYEAYQNGTLEKMLLEEEFTELGIKRAIDYISKKNPPSKPKRKGLKKIHL